MKGNICPRWSYRHADKYSKMQYSDCYTENRDRDGTRICREPEWTVLLVGWVVPSIGSIMNGKEAWEERLVVKNCCKVQMGR